MTLNLNYKRDSLETHLQKVCAERDELAELLERLLAGYDEERGAIDVEPDAHCLDCTSGTTPIAFGQKSCALHASRRALAKRSA